MKRKVMLIARFAIGLLLIPAAAVAPRALAQDKESVPDKKSLVEDFKLFELAPGDQGNRDVCSLFAITGAAEFEYAKHGDVGSSRVDLQACKLEYSIVSPK